MDPDIVMSIGLVLAIVTFPPLIGATLHDGRPSKIVVFMALVALSVMVIAEVKKPEGYALTELPGVLLSVIGRYF